MIDVMNCEFRRNGIGERYEAEARQGRFEWLYALFERLDQINFLKGSRKRISPLL
jgi:hypothetical protein